MLYFELCEVWGGSPATEQIESGIKSVDMTRSEYVLTPTTSSTDIDTDVHSKDNESDNLLSDEEDASNNNSTSAVLTPSTVRKRREFLDKKLCENKQEKMKRKLPVDAQLLDCAQEDIRIKTFGGANG